jgi:hypothetical protein
METEFHIDKVDAAFYNGPADLASVIRNIAFHCALQSIVERGRVVRVPSVWEGSNDCV